MTHGGESPITKGYLSTQVVNYCKLMTEASEQFGDWSIAVWHPIH